MIAGISAGILLSHPVKGEERQQANSDFLELIAKTKGNITERKLTKDELLLELNQEGADLFNSLSPEGQQLAIKLASRGCNNNNDCAGENACHTDRNKCAGKGKCKGQTKCAFSDKNLAVKVAAKKMEEKRMQLQKN